MGFGKMMELLQIKNKGKIVFCNAGNFYIAIGKDAVLLKELLGLKLSCFKPEVCKVGFPIASLEKYIEYMLQVIFKLPRTEKFSIGTEYKRAMYEMTENILIISKVSDKNIINYLNKIDAELSLQRIYLRIMKKNKWIDEKKFKVAMEQIYEIGKILGGLIKYYAKNNTK